MLLAISTSSWQGGGRKIALLQAGTARTSETGTGGEMDHEPSVGVLAWCWIAGMEGGHLRQRGVWVRLLGSSSAERTGTMLIFSTRRTVADHMSGSGLLLGVPAIHSPLG